MFVLMVEVGPDGKRLSAGAIITTHIVPYAIIHHSMAAARLNYVSVAG